MRRSRRGNERELRVADRYERHGWVVASRRHMAGPADLLAVCADRPPHLIEVKSTAGGPYERFGPAARLALLRLAHHAGGEAWLAWWPPGGQLQMIPDTDWPGARLEMIPGQLEIPDA